MEWGALIDELIMKNFYSVREYLQVIRRGARSEWVGGRGWLWWWWVAEPQKIVCPLRQWRKAQIDASYSCLRDNTIKSPPINKSTKKSINEQYWKSPTSTREINDFYFILLQDDCQSFTYKMYAKKMKCMGNKSTIYI